MTTQNTPATDQGRDAIREIALKLNHLPARDFEALAGVKRDTAESWRRRGKGPAYVLLGTEVYYPMDGVEAFMREKARRPGRMSIAGAL